MALKGCKKNGGRKKGSLNKETVNAMAIADRLKIDPFEILLRFAAGDWKGLGYENEVYHKETASGEVKLGYVISPEVRAKASSEATKYLYPQRKAMELSTDEAKGFAIVIKDYSSK